MAERRLARPPAVRSRPRSSDLPAFHLRNGGRSDDARDRRVEPEVPAPGGCRCRSDAGRRGQPAPRACPWTSCPSSCPPTVEIQTEALGLSAAEVEQLITVPLEQDLLNGVAFLDDIRSESVPGLSRILLVFEPGTDIFRARQVVAERLTQAHALPNVSKPPQMLQPLSSTNRVHDDRGLLEERLRRSRCRCSPAGRSPRASWAYRASRTSPSGDSGTGSCRCRSNPERLRAQGVSLVPGHRDGRERAVGVAA